MSNGLIATIGALAPAELDRPFLIVPPMLWSVLATPLTWLRAPDCTQTGSFDQLLVFSRRLGRSLTETKVRPVHGGAVVNQHFDPRRRVADKR
jgi:hypothetical protein